MGRRESGVAVRLVALVAIGAVATALGCGDTSTDSVGAAPSGAGSGNEAGAAPGGGTAGSPASGGSGVAGIGTAGAAGSGGGGAGSPGHAGEGGAGGELEPAGGAAGAPPVAIAQFTASPRFAGGSGRLSWSASGAQSCSIDPGPGAVDAASQLDVEPQAATEYTLTCSGTAGDVATATATVEVVYATSVSASEGNGCAALSTGQVSCWGNNTYGQLGQGNTEDMGDEAGEMAQLIPISLGADERVVQISPVSGSVCSVTEDGDVYCWGRNEYGQLGLGHTDHLGDAPGEMAALQPVPLGTAATAVSAAPRYSCALLSGGTVKCWGDNGADNDQLGGGQTQPIGDNPGEVAALQPIDFGVGVSAQDISAGPFHACAALGSDGIACWGMIPQNFNSGWLATLPVRISVGGTAVAVEAGYYHTCVLLEGGQVKCWGGDAGVINSLLEVAALPAIDLGSGATATAITVGNGYTCAILDATALKCWGSNSNGELGLGVDDFRLGDPSVLAPVDLGTGLGVIDVAAGWTHTCALLASGSLKCWGRTWAGRLGLDDDLDRGTLPEHMGDGLPFVIPGLGP